MEVDVALHVRVRHRVWQHRERGRLGDGAGEQVALRGVDVRVLVRVFAHERLVTVDEALDGLVDVGGLGALDVFVEAVVGVGARHFVQVVLDERMLHEVLDVFDLGGAVVAFLDFAFHLASQVADHTLLFGPDFFVEVREGGLDGFNDVDGVEIHDATIALFDQHRGRVPCLCPRGVHDLSFHALSCSLKGPVPPGRVAEAPAAVGRRTCLTELYAKATPISSTTRRQMTHILGFR